MINDGFLGCDRLESLAQVKDCLTENSFQGFMSVKRLRLSKCDLDADFPGMYLVAQNPA